MAGRRRGGPVRGRWFLDTAPDRLTLMFDVARRSVVGEAYQERPGGMWEVLRWDVPSRAHTHAADDLELVHTRGEAIALLLEYADQLADT